MCHFASTSFRKRAILFVDFCFVTCIHQYFMQYTIHEMKQTRQELSFFCDLYSPILHAMQTIHIPKQSSPVKILDSCGGIPSRNCVICYLIVLFVKCFEHCVGSFLGLL